MQGLGSNELANILSGSRRFINPVELWRFVTHCSLRRDTVYVVEYECVLVPVGSNQMDPLWVEAFRRVKELGVKVHLLSILSPADIIAAEGENVFHQIHQCLNDDERIQITRSIRAFYATANIVCVGTEFVHLVRRFHQDDFVYHVSSLQLPPWRTSESVITEEVDRSVPIAIHRLYVFQLIVVAHFFASFAALEHIGEAPPEIAGHEEE